MGLFGMCMDIIERNGIIRKKQIRVTDLGGKMAGNDQKKSPVSGLNE